MDLLSLFFILVDGAIALGLAAAFVVGTRRRSRRNAR